MPQKFLPAVFAVRRDQLLVEALGPDGRRALLPRLLASIDALIQAVDAHYTAHRRVFGRRRRGKKETAERAADRRAADQHDMVSRGSRTPSGPLPAISADLSCSQMVLLIRLMQQHVVATRVLADATLEVARNKQRVVWPGVAGSGDDEEPEWRDVPIEGMD